jgi:hypothetical protein
MYFHLFSLSLSFTFSLRIFGHSESLDHSSSFCGGTELSIDEEEELNEKMAAAVRAELPANLAEKLKVGGICDGRIHADMIL